MSKHENDNKHTPDSSSKSHDDHHHDDKSSLLSFFVNDADAAENNDDKPHHPANPEVKTFLALDEHPGQSGVDADNKSTKSLTDNGMIIINSDGVHLSFGMGSAIGYGNMGEVLSGFPTMVGFDNASYPEYIIDGNGGFSLAYMMSFFGPNGFSSVSTVVFTHAVDSYAANFMNSIGYIDFGNIGNYLAGFNTGVNYASYLNASNSFSNHYSSSLFGFNNYFNNYSAIDSSIHNFSSQTSNPYNAVFIEISYGNQGVLINGIDTQISFGNNGGVTNGFETISYGNQNNPTGGIDISVIAGGGGISEIINNPIGVSINTPPSIPPQTTIFTPPPQVTQIENHVVNNVSDLAVTLTTLPQAAIPGQINIENYVLHITNNAAGVVTSMTITDSLLSQLTNSQLTLPAGSSFDAATGVLSSVSLGQGQSIDLGISGVLNPAANLIGQLIYSTAVEPNNVVDNNQGNNTVINPVPLNPVADLVVSFLTSPQAAIPGQANAENYVLNIVNNGPSTITSLTLTDTLLSQLSNAQFTLPAGSSFNAANGVLSGISLASGQSLNFGINGVLTPAASLVGLVVDTAIAEPNNALDPNQLNNVAMSNVALNPVADLAISFLTQPQAAIPGQANLENYVLHIVNNGPSTINSITLTDSLLAELSNANFTLPAGSSYDAATHVLSGISLAQGQSLNFGISGTLSPLGSLTGVVIDTATVEPTNALDANQLNNAAVSNIQLNPTADLAISFASAPTSATPGVANSESYVLHIVNNGPSTITSLVITDSLLHDLSNANFTLPAGSSFDPATGILSGISLAQGQDLNLGITGTPLATLVGQVIDTATVEPINAVDVNQLNNAAVSTSITFNPLTDLAISFLSSPAAAIPGQANIENYVLQITNNGPSTVSSMTISDSLLAQLTNAHFTLPAGSSYDAATHVLSGISLAQGQSVNFGISGILSPLGSLIGTIVDTTNVEPNNAVDVNQLNNVATSAICLNPTADLAISFGSAPISATPGVLNSESYVLHIVNNGPSNVTSLVITDSLLAQLTNAHFTFPSGSSFDPATGILSGISLAQGQSVDLGITGTPLATLVGQLIDTATVEPSNMLDSNQLNNSAISSIINFNPITDLSIAFATSPQAAVPGQSNTESYVLQITNNGPSTVSSITISDTLLNQLTNAHFTLPAGSSYDANSHMLSGISLAQGQSLNFGISGTLSPLASLTGVVVDTATVEPNNALDANQLNNIAVSNVALNPSADLAVSFATSSQAAIPGQANVESYVLHVVNNGPSTVTSVTISDSLLAQLTNVSFTLPAGSSYDATTHILSGISLAQGQALNFGISGTLSPLASATGLIVDTASVTPNNNIVDTNLLNNTAVSNVALNPSADLAVSFATAPIAAIPGQANVENYVLHVVNNGPSTVTSVTISDSLLAQLTNVSFTLPVGSSYNATTHILSGISLAQGQALNFGISGTLSPLASATGLIVDTASVTPNNNVVDTNLLNNTVVSNVALNPSADLAVSFASDPQNVGPGHANSESYVLHITNNGPSTVTSITLTDSLLNQLTNAHFTLPAGSSYDAATHILSGISLAQGQSLNFGISGTLTTAASLTGIIVDTATVEPNNAVDINQLNNTSISNLTCNPEADLAVSLATAPAAAIPGQANIENYVLHVVNNGPSTVTSVTISDSLLAQLTNANFTLPAGSSYDAARHILSGISLAQGQALNFGISGTLSPLASATGLIVDTASVTPNNAIDTNLLNNTVVSNVNLTPNTDLGISFATAPQNASPSHATSENYTLHIVNNGPSTVNSMVITDSLLTELTNTHFTLPTGSSYDATTHVLSGISLASGQSLNFGISGTLAAHASGQIIDTATVEPNNASDINQANNTVTNNINCNPEANLAITNVLTTTGAIHDGEHVTYKVTISNQGPDAASNVVVSDSSFTDLSGITLSGASAGTISGTNWNVGTIASGASYTITVSGVVTHTGMFSNTVTATTSTIDLNPNPSATATSTAVSASDCYHHYMNCNNDCHLPTQITCDTGSHTYHSLWASNCFINAINYFDHNNNCSTVTCTNNHYGSCVNSVIVNDVAPLNITNIASNVTPHLNGLETFTVHLTNTGHDAANNITVTDLLPHGLAFVSDTTGVGQTYNSNTGAWTIPSLAAGASTTLTLVAKVETANVVANTATLTEVGNTHVNALNHQATTTISPSSVLSERCDLFANLTAKNACLPNTSTLAESHHHTAVNNHASAGTCDSFAGNSVGEGHNSHAVINTDISHVVGHG